jgi:hypothetical protein
MDERSRRFERTERLASAPFHAISGRRDTFRRDLNLEHRG